MNSNAAYFKFIYKSTILALCIVVFASIQAFGQQKLKKRKYDLTYKQDQLTQEYFIDGVKFVMLEDNSRALKMFRKALQLDYNNPAIHHQIAKIYQEDLKFDLALPHARFAYDQDGKNEYHYLSLADIYKSLNKKKESTKIFEKLVKNFKNQDYVFELAESYYGQKEYDKCLDLLDDFIEQYGAFPEVIGYKQNIYREQNKLDKAIEEGEALMKTNPANAQFVMMQLDLYKSAKMPNEAVSLAKKFLKEQGDNASVLLRLSGLQRDLGKKEESDQNFYKAFNSPGISYNKKIDMIALQTREIYVAEMKGRKAPEALALCEKMCAEIIKRHPDKAKSYAVNGDLSGLKKEKKNARDYYLKAVLIDDSDYKIWEQLILIDAELEQYDSLVKHSENALEIFPNQGVIWYFNGSAHFVKKDYKKSIKGFEQARKLSRSNKQLLADINAQLGDAYHSNNQFEKSYEAYDNVLSLNPENEHVLNNYSYHLSLANERLEDAYTMSKKTLDKHPDNPIYIDTHAWVLYKLKKYDEAKKLLVKIQAKATNGEVVEHLGDVLFQLGEKEKAKERWGKAMELGGGSEFLKSKIEKGELYE